MAFIFRVSIGANIVLAGVVAALLLHRQAPTPVSAATPAHPAVARPEPPNPSSPAKDAPSSASATKLTPSSVAQLEQLGIPRDTLVNVLLEDLNQRQTQQIAALQKKYAPALVPDRLLLEFARECDAERVRELKAAFGEEGYRAWDKQQTLRELNRARPPGDELPMSPEEAEQAYQLQKEFNAKAKELQEATEDGVADRADASALQAQAQQMLDRELEKLLGKQRLDALKGNVDPTTSVYRNYGDLSPTPEQAKAVLQAEQDYRDREAALAARLSDNSADTANFAADLKALRDAQDEKLRQIFGADAYDNQKRQSDPTYRTLKQFASAWDLKDEQVQPVYDAVHAFEDQADRTRAVAEMRQAAGQHVNWREINSTIEQARQQVEASLANQIGAEPLRRMEQNGVLAHR